MDKRPPLPPLMTLERAASEISHRVGSEWSVDDVIAAATRLEISLFARLAIDAHMVRVAPKEGVENEMIFPAGSLPCVSPQSAEHLLAGPSAEYRVHCEAVIRRDGCGGHHLVGMKPTWRLADGAEVPSFTAADCRVLASAVWQVVDANLIIVDTIPTGAVDGRASRVAGTKWTDHELDELKSDRKLLGTKKAAERHGISESRLRKLLPGKDESGLANEPLAIHALRWTARSR